MKGAHFQYWPKLLALNLIAPATNLFYNAEVSARRYPNKPFIIFYDTTVSFAEFHREASYVAGYLINRCDIGKGDRVLLLMQNSPQFMIGYYGILRANAVVVPLNPMNITEEILGYAQDAGATTLIVSQELYPRVEPLLKSGQLKHVIVAAYSDYLKEATTLSIPEFIASSRVEYQGEGLALWKDVLAEMNEPGPLTTGPDDLCVMPYTSGTTGRAKGCMHTHRTAMHTAMGAMRWFSVQPEQTLLAVLPLFHVTGMQLSFNGPLLVGATVVLLPRWDRDAAAQCIERYKVTSWTAVPTMIQDFFLNPKTANWDLSSIRYLNGGGAAMPAAVVQRLTNAGITYIEGYGLSETIAATHINPPDRAKRQCLGVPIFDTDSRIIDPVTLSELSIGEVGEIVIRGPQVFLGYWNKPEDTTQAFVYLDGERFLRTGDLGRMDDDGYFFIVDRLKRMINASGFKVWPTEVESLLYHHPAIQEACVIGAKDDHRAETVKAVIVLRQEWRGRVEADAIISWCREQMAAYKVPRLIEFVDVLPKSGSGKIMWRELQEREVLQLRAR